MAGTRLLKNTEFTRVRARSVVRPYVVFASTDTLPAYFK